MKSRNVDVWSSGLRNRFFLEVDLPHWRTCNLRRREALGGRCEAHQNHAAARFPRLSLAAYPESRGAQLGR